MAEPNTRERWDDLLVRCGWTGKIPAGTPPPTVQSAHTTLTKAQEAARAGDWPLAEMHVRLATAAVFHAVDSSPEAKREAKGRRVDRDAAEERERARRAADRKAENAARAAAITSVFQVDLAWELIRATVAKVGATLNPCPPLEDGAPDLAGAIDQAWHARDMVQLRAACEAYADHWTRWWEARARA